MTSVAAPSAAAPQNYLGGIALRLLAMASLSLMFVVVKYVDRSGIHIVESLFWRQALVLPFLLLWVMATGGFASLKTNRIGAHTRRMLMGLTGMACNFGGMILLPMAEATTISLSVPIFAVIFAALLLGEATGWQRWSAVVIGFVGVLVVLDPFTSFAGGFGGAHGLGTLVALAGAIMTALITIAVRDLGRTENAATIVFWFSLLSMIPLGIALPFVFTPHSGSEWLLLLALGFLGAVVQMSLTGALRLAPVAVVIPMDYSSLLWAIAAGWWFFGTLPADTTWVGAPLIIASGLFIAWREHRRHIARPKEVAA
ncbi:MULTISPECIES: DMT family transporter [unclassified Sphingopyxis]|jgi:drug/metabolite transporter (DMT)-like permease|uniref:DMT family transporter n=1 Tax=unclassified Sphingopyxis TaxID=2614943 RepID=UPI00285CEF27|nr:MULTISPECIES: DMT family transporter [unclassified Sphingopyxis]MDR6832308.1 drug/metabolite transporter (DMT)-like permease [Sphingopyxis sp. BE122]MDR7228051.1 drug/metabolite transporter (DMT)-like permease [Sphingopyxis sp. BE259]